MLALGPGLGMAFAMVCWYYDFVAKLGHTWDILVVYFAF